MARYFRIQEIGIAFETMQNYNSEDGGDGESEGLCVSDKPWYNSSFGGAWDAYDDNNGEIVIMEGQVITQIYDGYRIYPTKEIARFTKGEWRKMIQDETAWNYE